MEIKNPWPCCDRSVKTHGKPVAFVTRLFTCPAANCEAYLEERMKLDVELLDANACAHYAATARIVHTELLGNREHEDMAATAVYCNVNPLDFGTLGIAG